MDALLAFLLALSLNQDIDFVFLEGLTVHFGQPSEVQYLCRLATHRRGAVACYNPTARLIVVARNDEEALAHELKHWRCPRCKHDDQNRWEETAGREDVGEHE